MTVNDDYKEVFDVYTELGTYQGTATKLGVDVKTVKRRLKKYFNHPEYAAMAKAAHTARIDPDKVSHFWYTTTPEDGSPGMSMFVKNDNSMTFNEIREELVETLKNYSPEYKKIERPPVNDGHLLVVDPADVHIGKLSMKAETGFDYNIEVAKERMRVGIHELTNKARLFNIEKIVFVIGNDIIHTDTTKRTTTSGTSQDTDGMWWSAWMEAKLCYVAAIEELVQLADVHVVFCPSNHDYMSGFMLADTIYSWFSKHPNITFGEKQQSISINHRKYVVYGDNLLGFSHGDGSKPADMPNLMQYEAREAWGNAKYSYLYLHHYHHKIRDVYGMNKQKLEKDNIGVTILHQGQNLNPKNNVYVEYVRSPSAPDSWHSRNGYCNEQAIEVFIHHPRNGQIARLTHFF